MTLRIAPITLITSLVVGGLNLALIAAVAMHLMSSDQATSDQSDWNAHLSASIAGAAGRMPIEAYGKILAHPVFFKSREPFVPALPVPVSAPPQPRPIVVDPGLVVAGVVVKNGFSKVYLLSRTDPGGTWASEGDTFQGWKVKSIDGSGVRLVQADRAIDLKLYPH